MTIISYITKALINLSDFVFPFLFCLLYLFFNTVHIFHLHIWVIRKYVVLPFGGSIGPLQFPKFQSRFSISFLLLGLPMSIYVYCSWNQVLSSTWSFSMHHWTHFSLCPLQVPSSDFSTISPSLSLSTLKFRTPVTIVISGDIQ